MPPAWRASFLGPPPASVASRSPPNHGSDRIRLWKCRRHGNHKPVSTAPWKSRTDREIPTFPQADACWYLETKAEWNDAITRDR